MTAHKGDYQRPTTVDRTTASDAEFQARVAPIEAAPAAEESWDATAALRRVLHFADAYERGEIGDPGRAVVAWMIRVAVHDTTDVMGPLGSLT